MECNNCGNSKAYAIRMGKDPEFGWMESCDLCGRVSSSGAHIPDVYWSGPGYHPGIVDNFNKPIYLESRRQKAELMRAQNSREAGDLYHGQRGTEFAHMQKANGKVPNQNVLKLKKMFQEHDSFRR